MQRPECFDFAMDFLGQPEELEIMEYIEYLEAKVNRLQGSFKEITDKTGPLNGKDAWTFYEIAEKAQKDDS